MPGEAPAGLLGPLPDKEKVEKIVLSLDTDADGKASISEVFKAPPLRLLGPIAIYGRITLDSTPYAGEASFLQTLRHP